jgi:hypothetical protein
MSISRIDTGDRARTFGSSVGAEAQQQSGEIASNYAAVAEKIRCGGR